MKVLGSVGSLFAGIGGMDLGFERQGFKIKWQVEIDDFATKVLEKNWPTPTANEDAAGTPNGKMQKMLGNHPDVRNSGSGTLNPAWVEWLMGFPIGFTEIDA